MFEQLKMAGALAGLMKNKEGLKAAGERIRSRLREMRAGGAAGGGAVRATATGELRIESIQIEPALAAGLADPASRAYAEQLITEAVNNALDQAKAIAQREAAKEAEALGLPGMDGLAGMLGG
jgi:DNA-binding protein YbaB